MSTAPTAPRPEESIDAGGRGRPRTRGKKRDSGAAAKVITVATPWGAAVVVDEVGVPQKAKDRRFAVVAQLLETREGERLVRFAYTTDGSARRGPVTMRARDLERLRAALERAPVLGQVLRM